MNKILSNSLERKAGIGLVIHIVLLVFTMVLHPAGGSIEYLMRIRNVIIATHSIAIFSLPFGWIGFWGLTRKIGADSFGSMLGFAMISVGLLAGLLAAPTNGLVLPIFLQHYKDATPEELMGIRSILRYGFAVNHAFDYIYTGAFCVAIGCWSVMILLAGALARWIGWMGIAVAVGLVVVFALGAGVNNLLGLRIFISGVAMGVLVVGVVLYRGG